MFTGYREYLSQMDYFILTLGVIMALIQISFYVGYLLRLKNLEYTILNWLDWLNGIFEIFPLLGLLGTVNGLLNTFNQIGISPDDGVDVMGMLKSFAPAMTTTVSGIVDLLLNLALYFVLVRLIWLERMGASQK